MSSGSNHCPPGSRSGFLAVDLLVVSLVLALLAGIAVANATGRILWTRKASLSWTLGELQAACDTFCAVCGEAPAAPGPSGPRLIAFSASDHGGKTFVPAYLRRRPSTAAGAYGLRADDVPSVYFGVTPGGRVFATQQAPDLPDGWTSIESPVFVSGSLDGLEYSAISGDDCQGPPAPPVPPAPPGPPAPPVPPLPPSPPDPPAPPDAVLVASIELVSSKSTATTGEEVVVTAVARAGDGRVVPGVCLSFEVSGSVTGARSLTCLTDDAGRAHVAFTTDEAEVVVVRARALQ